jgi:hypothetical protein
MVADVCCSLAHLLKIRTSIRGPRGGAQSKGHSERARIEAAAHESVANRFEAITQRPENGIFLGGWIRNSVAAGSLSHGLARDND